MGAGVAIGIGVAAAFGVALDKYGYWNCFGVSFGIAIGLDYLNESWRSRIQIRKILKSSLR